MYHTTYVRLIIGSKKTFIIKKLPVWMFFIHVLFHNLFLQTQELSRLNGKKKLVVSINTLQNHYKSRISY